jgi:tRNA(fMet)-specific endonuclease VapC
LLADVAVVSFDDTSAKEFGRLRGTLARQGVAVSRIDLMIAAVALTRNLTLVTHNTVDFENIPDLRVQDWLVP